MKILAIESSCDESALAVVESGSQPGDPLQVHYEGISSQIDLHKLYGGVVPELASREHLKNLPLLFDDLRQRDDLADIDAIAVTTGPGLQGCLLMGKCFADGLSKVLAKPLFAINHIEGHVFAAFLDAPNIQFPFLALVVSGGHTEIVFVTAPGSYEILSRSSDDAAGEAFDKSAFLLGFEYPGGMHLAKMADAVQQSRFTLPRLKQNPGTFSFSGLKTAIRLLTQKQDLNDEQVKKELCFAVQESIVNELSNKLRFHVAEKNCRTVIVTGGVAANRRLREVLAAMPGTDVFFPSREHCTDNAAMIGAAALKRQQYGALKNQILSIAPGWRIEAQ